MPHGWAGDKGGKARASKRRQDSAVSRDPGATALTSWAEAAKLIHSGHQPGSVENLEREEKEVSMLGNLRSVTTSSRRGPSWGRGTLLLSHHQESQVSDCRLRS